MAGCLRVERRNPTRTLSHLVHSPPKQSTSPPQDQIWRTIVQEPPLPMWVACRIWYAQLGPIQQIARLCWGIEEPYVTAKRNECILLVLCLEIEDAATQPRERDTIEFGRVLFSYPLRRKSPWSPRDLVGRSQMRELTFRAKRVYVQRQDLGHKETNLAEP